MIRLTLSFYCWKLGSFPNVNLQSYCTSKWEKRLLRYFLFLEYCNRWFCKILCKYPVLWFGATIRSYYRAFLVAQLVKNPPAMQETLVPFLGQEDPLEKGMATHSSILAWKIPWTEEPGRLQSMRLQRVGHTKRHGKSHYSESTNKMLCKLQESKKLEVLGKLRGRVGIWDGIVKKSKNSTWRAMKWGGYNLRMKTSTSLLTK